MRELLATALQRANGYLLEPPPAAEPEIEVRPFEAPPAGLNVLLLGLTRPCGLSTLARGLAAQLSAGGTRQGHVISLGATDRGSGRARTIHGGGRFWDVPATLYDQREVGEYGRLVSRLVGDAAIVWDVPATEVERVRGLLPQTPVLVAPAQSQPALAELVAETLSERFAGLRVVANRVRSPDPWSGRAALCIPESKVAAMFAIRGRRPGGEFGAALARLAMLVGAEPLP